MAKKEQHHVAGVHRHLGHLEGLRGGISEKLVVGVVPLIEQGQRNVALSRNAADSSGGQAVPRSKIRDDIGHGIVPNLGDHQQFQIRILPAGGASQRNHRVEGGTSRDDIQHRLSDADNGLRHDILVYYTRQR